ncbi:MAG: hypothetical protein ICV78_09355, partial [Tolypothrix sp. Co-bin9]|nr:hypothetical protein [Tolypothrix sp. Co-bin9]
MLTGVAVLGSVLWATAFFRIYTEDHSRVQANRWANNPRNVPTEAVVTKEHWDDPLIDRNAVSFELYN